jgi:hypothetical protein
MMKNQSGKDRAMLEAQPRWAVPLAIGLLAFAFTASAQDPAPSDARWLPWLGCWDLVAETVDLQGENQAADAMVCLTPRAEGPGVAIKTIADGEVVLQETFIANSEKNPTEEPGCEGWQSAEWSWDGNRLFHHSQIQCEGEELRTVSGVSLMRAPTTWLNIQMIRAGDSTEIVVRRFVPADAAELAAAGMEPTPIDTLMARLDASRPLKMTDIVEASRNIEPEAVEALIVETDARFGIDSKALIGLASSDVPPRVIDLMVAVSFPDRFRVSRQGLVAEQPRPEAGGGGGGIGSDLFWLNRNPYYYYYYWNPFLVGAPFGYHSFYGPYDYYGRRYVLTTSMGVLDSGGKVVRGGGYSRIERIRGTGSWGGGDFGRGGSGVSPGGYTSGGSGGSGRSAKPRD